MRGRTYYSRKLGWRNYLAEVLAHPSARLRTQAFIRQIWRCWNKGEGTGFLEGEIPLLGPHWDPMNSVMAIMILLAQ